MSELTQTGGTRKVSVTVVKNEFGDWEFAGEAPENTTVDPKSGEVFVSAKSTAPETKAVSTSTNTKEVVKDGVSEVNITVIPLISVDDDILDEIATHLSPEDWEKRIGGDVGNKDITPTGKTQASDDDPILIPTSDGGTIIIPPKNPNIRTFTVRYMHYDGTTREYVIHRTESGWGNNPGDNCSPRTDATGTIVKIDASCTDDQIWPTPVPSFPSIPIPGSGSGGGGGGWTGAIEWQNNPIVTSSPYRRRSKPVVSNSRTVTSIATETTYVVRDTSRTYEVDVNDDTFIRIPHTEHRPVTKATLSLMVNTKKTNETKDKPGETSVVDATDNLVIEVERQSGRFVITSNNLPSYMGFSNDGIFRIPAERIVEGSEVNLSYTTMVRVGTDGGVIGVHKDANGTWQEVTESSQLTFDKLAISSAEPGFKLETPIIGTYRDGFIIEPAKDTGTVHLYVTAYDADGNVIIQGNSTLAPNGIGWLSFGDAEGKLHGNTYTGKITLKRDVFNGKAGKITAIAMDDHKSLSKAITLDVTGDEEHYKDLPEANSVQPAKPMMTVENGSVIIDYLDKERSFSGEFSFVNSRTKEENTFRWTRNSEGEITFEQVSGAIDRLTLSQLQYKKVPHFSLTIPHWLVKNDTEVMATVSGDPNKASEWTELSRRIFARAPDEAITVSPALVDYNEESDVLTIKPQENAFTVGLTYTGIDGVERKVTVANIGTEGEPDWKIVDKDFTGIGYSNDEFEVTKETGVITFRDMSTKVNPSAVFATETGSIDGDVAPAKTSTAIGNPLPPFDELKAGLGTDLDLAGIDTKPFTLAFDTDGVHIKHHPDEAGPHYEDGFDNQYLLLTSPDDTATYLYAHFARTDAGWSIRRLSTVNNSGLRLAEVWSSKGNEVTIKAHAFALAYLGAQDFVGENIPVKARMLVAWGNSKHMSLDATHNFTFNAVMAKSTLTTDGASFAHAYQTTVENPAGSRNLMLPMAEPHEFTERIAPLYEYNNADPTKLSTERDTNKLLNMGIIGANLALTDPQRQLNPSRDIPMNWMEEMVEQPQENRKGFVYFQENNDYNNSSSHLLKMFHGNLGGTKDIYGLDKMIVGFRGNDGKIRFLQLKLQRERVKAKDFPLLYNIHNADGSANFTYTNSAKRQVTMEHGEWMFSIPNTDSNVNFGWNQPGGEFLKVLTEQFNERYLDEFVTDKPNVTTRSYWVEDGSTKKISDYIRYATTKEHSNSYYSIRNSTWDAAWGNQVDIETNTKVVYLDSGKISRYLVAQDPLSKQAPKVVGTTEIMDWSYFNQHMGETTANILGVDMKVKFGVRDQWSRSSFSTDVIYRRNTEGVLERLTKNQAGTQIMSDSSHETNFKGLMSYVAKEAVEVFYINLLEAKHESVPTAGGMRRVVHVFLLTHHHGGWNFARMAYDVDYFTNKYPTAKNYTIQDDSLPRIRNL